MQLSTIQHAILTAAADHPSWFALAPNSLPAAARNAVVRSMLKQGLLVEVAAPAKSAAFVWRKDADGGALALQATETGLRVISDAQHEASTAACAAPLPAAAESVVLAAPDAVPHVLDGAAAEAPQLPPQAANGAVCRSRLADAARTVLAAWDVPDHAGLPDALAALRAALPAGTTRQPGPPTQRAGTKHAAVLAMLRRADGATVAQIAEATGWANHTVRGFFAGLKKRQGIEVTVLERVRQVGPGKQGAVGSYTVYRIGEAS